MSAPARNSSRRRIAALNFLSNISLDGSHRDTKYSIFLKRGFDGFDKPEKALNNKNSEAEPANSVEIQQSSRTDVTSKSTLLQSSDDPISFVNIDLQLSRKCDISSTKRHRIVLVSSRKVPFAVFSTLPYTKQALHGTDNIKKKQERASHLFGSCDILLHQLMLAVEDGQDVSYSQFLVPSKSKPGPSMKKVATHDSQLLYPIAENMASAQSSPDAGSQDLAYDPNLLDDPELKSGKHRTLMSFPSYRTSVIDYARPSDLKKELNEKFKETFPHIQLTLSKLRSLKRDIKKIGHAKCGVDLWSIAQAYVFFEKIIIKGIINKANRRLVAGASLMLSAKLNDVKGSDLTKLVDEIEDYFKLHRKELLRCEFAVLVALEFSLHINDMEVYPVYQRLMYAS